MFNRTCICGHNFFFHRAKERSDWVNAIGEIVVSIYFSLCNIPGCECMSFIEKEQSRTERSKP